MSLDFKKFNTGTLFLVRTPDVFPEGYADASFADMKHNLHLDYAALLETWNCKDGVLWKSDKLGRSKFWEGEDRDPVEECFLAADKYGMAFLPEAGMMDEAFMHSHEDGMRLCYTGERQRYGRIGLVPACPDTLEYLIFKYDLMLDQFKHHPSCQGVCLPCENGIITSYDAYTREAYRRAFGCEMPSPEEMIGSTVLHHQVYRFLEGCFLEMYRTLARHVKQKYGLPLMHYPLDQISSDSFCQESYVCPSRNITVMTQAKELDLLNMQLHPPLYPNPYFFKLETEYLMANAGEIPCMADTHFYHEGAAGRVPDMTPKRVVDNILGTLTPYGISFFCYGFMAEELPLWKKELNPGAPVYRAYSEPHTQKARRQMCLRSMDFVEQLRPFLEGTHQTADCAIYFPETMNAQYLYSSYATEHIFGLHELLNAAAIPTKVAASIPTSASEQKALILSSVHEISEEDTERLAHYLADGGRLIVIGKCCKEIEELAGLSVSLSDEKVVQAPESVKYNHYRFRLPVDGKHYCEQNGEPILRYEDGSGAITRKGNVIFVGTSDAIGRFSLYRDYDLVSFFKGLLLAEKLHHGVEFHSRYVNSTDAHQFVSCDVFRNEKKACLFIRNFGVEQSEATVAWELPENMKIVSAIADGKAFAYRQNEPLPLFEHFVAICAENE